MESHRLLKPSSWKTLLDYRRNELIENSFHGAVSWFHGDNLLYSFGETHCYGRSTMKPFYIKVFVDELDSVLNIQQKAISLGSHNGWAEQVLVAQSILDKEELLQTPLSLPLVQQVGREVVEPSRWWNNSSGHHAAILRGCGLKAWSQKDYMSLEHPLFESYQGVLSQALGISSEFLRNRLVARDGDGLPTLEMSVHEIAQCYSYLARNFEEDWIKEAMVTEPFLVGGVGRLDTVILQSCGGRVLAKEGADGLLALAISHEDFADGLGVAIKLAHGWDPQATWFVAYEILKSLGFTVLRETRPLNTTGEREGVLTPLDGCSWAPGFGRLKRQRALVSPLVVPPSLRGPSTCFGGEGEQGFEA